MRARYVQVEKAGAPLKLVMREIPEPRGGEEKYTLDHAAEAYDRMMSGKARFRVVLEMGA